MPIKYTEFRYDFNIDGSFADWLETKDSEGWEFVTALRDYSNLSWNHIFLCVFRRKV